MTDTTIVVVIAAVPPTLAAFAALVTAVRTGRQVAEVHTLTNRNFSEQKQEIADLRAELERLKAKLGAAATSAQTAENTRITLAAETKADAKK